MDEVQIGPVRTPADLAAVVDLFRAYAASLDVDLAFQDFEAELAGMPGKYARPKGALLLARGSDGAPVGCVGLRPMHAAGCCEMKRLFVTPEGPGCRAGRPTRGGPRRNRRADRLLRDAARYAAHHGRRPGALPQVRVRYHRAILPDADRRHDLHAPRSEPCKMARPEHGPSR